MKSIRLNGLKRLLRERTYGADDFSLEKEYERLVNQKDVKEWQDFIDYCNSQSDENQKYVKDYLDKAVEQLNTLNGKDVNPTDNRNENDTTTAADDAVETKSNVLDNESDSEEFWSLPNVLKIRQAIAKFLINGYDNPNFNLNDSVAGNDSTKINVKCETGANKDHIRQIVKFAPKGNIDEFKDSWIDYLKSIIGNENEINSFEQSISMGKDSKVISVKFSVDRFDYGLEKRGGIYSSGKHPSLKVPMNLSISYGKDTIQNTNNYSNVDFYFTFEYSFNDGKAFIISNVMVGNTFKISDSVDYSNYIKDKFPSDKFSDADMPIVRNYLIALLEESKNGVITTGKDLLNAALNGENFDTVNLKTNASFEMNNPINNLSLSQNELDVIKKYQGSIRLDFGEVFGSFASASGLVRERIIVNNNVNVEFPISSTEPLVDSYITGELTKTRKKIKISSKYGKGGDPSSASMWEIVHNYLNSDGRKETYEKLYPDAVAMNEWMYENVTLAENLNVSYATIAYFVWDVIRGIENVGWITKKQIEELIGSELTNFIANYDIDLKKENINGDEDYCNKLLKLLRAIITPQYSNELNSIIKEEIETLKIENPKVKSTKKDLFNIIKEDKDLLNIETKAFENVMRCVKNKNNEYIRSVILRIFCKIFAEVVNNNGVVDTINRIFFESFDMFLQVYLKEFKDITTLPVFKFEIKIIYDGKDINEFKRYNYKLVMKPSLSLDGKFQTTKFSMTATEV